MNKSFFCGVAVVTLILAGCSNDEVVQAPASTSAISFANTFVDNHTKTVASDPSSTVKTLEKFTVYGYQNSALLFNGTEVSSTDNGSTWSYSPLKYWQKDFDYHFVAIANCTATNNSIVLTDDAVSTIETSIDFTSDGVTDVLASTRESKKGIQSSPVGLTFNHLLSKVKFTFKNGFSSTDDVTIQVTDVKITDAYKTGTATVTAGYIADKGNAAFDVAWTSQKTADDYVLDFGETEYILPTGFTLSAESSSYHATKDEATKALLLIPSADTKSYTVTFTVHIRTNVGTDNEFEMANYAHTVTISNQALLQGYSYNFVAELKAENVNPDASLTPIQFSVSGINSWEEGGDVTTSTL